MTEPFVYANGQVAHNVDDLVKLCQQFPEDSTNYLLREDFEKWLSYIGANKIAQYAAEARQTTLTDRQKLDSFLASLQPKSGSKSIPQPSQTSQPTSQPSQPAQPKANLFSAIANFFKGK